MISSMASITSSTSASVRVDKATSEFLIEPDWTMNIEICDTINSNQMLAKDVAKAVKKRLQHKNPKVQLLALTLLETMVKNCGDYVHFQIAEKNILQEMVRIVKKKTDMDVRDKILTLIVSWHEAFGGSAGRYPQYHMAYEDLRLSGVHLPMHLPDSAAVFTLPIANPVSRNVQPGYGMPSSSATRLDEVMAADENLSSSSLNSMLGVLDLLSDMLQAVDPSDQKAVKDEVITDLVEQCRAKQRKLMQMLTTSGDEGLLAQGLELNDRLQSVLAKYDAIASGSPLPPLVTNVNPEQSVTPEISNKKPAEVTTPTATSNDNASPVQNADKYVVDEEAEEEDEFALLARRNSKTHNDAPYTKSSGAPSDEVPSSQVMSNALVPTSVPASSKQENDMDIIDLLSSITLSTITSTEESSSTMPPQAQEEHGLGSSAAASSEVAYSAGNNYIAPWAQPLPQHQPMYTSPSQSQYVPPHESGQFQYQPQAEHLPQSQFYVSPSPPQPQYSSRPGYPPPPWAATPGYFSNPNPNSNVAARQPHAAYSNPRIPTTRPFLQQPESLMNTGQKPYIPSYRLFEDLNVLGKEEVRSTTTGAALSTLSGSSNPSMVTGTK